MTSFNFVYDRLLGACNIRDAKATFKAFPARAI
jgi:hypothetical protein